MFYVSFDRLAGPHSRHFNLSVPFDTFQEAEKHLETIISEAETARDKMRIQHESIIITDKDLKNWSFLND